MKDVPENGVLLINGRRGSGKSFCLRDYLAHNQFPIGMVISPTEECNRFYGHFIPKIFIHYEYKSDLVSNLIRRQKMVIKRRDRELKNFGRSDIDPRAFLILDDCLASAQLINSDKALKWLFFNGRHAFITLILAFQFPLALMPALRGQVDVCCMFSEPNLGNKRRLWDNFGGALSLDAFCQVLDACTNDREMLVMWNSCISNNLSDRMFWYKAQPHDHLKVGLPLFWQMSADMPSSDEEDDGLPPYDPTSFAKRRNTPHLTVKKRQYV
jgi:hypothetical protein